MSSRPRIAEAVPEQLAAVVELCGRSFDYVPRAHFPRSMEHDPHADESITLITLLGDEMISTLRIFARTVRWRGGHLRLGGIGNVATDPAHRGRGHARRLMNHAIEVMADRGFQISLLFTGISGFYERVGYFRLHQTHWTVGPLREETEVRIPAREMELDRDIGSLLTLYAAFNRQRDGTQVRTEAHWRAMMKVHPREDVLAIVAETSGQVRAYARAAEYEGETSTRLHELAACDVNSAVALLTTAARRAARTNRELLVTLPADPLIRDAMEQTFEDVSMTMHPAGMWRDLPDGPSRAEIQERDGELYHWGADGF